MSDDKLPTQSHDAGDGRPPVRAGSGPIAARGPAALAPSASDRDGGGESTIDLRAYWALLVKRRWLVLSVLAGVVALALLITLLTSPRYRATASLQIDRDSVQAMKVEGINNLEGASTPDFLQTQYELLKSRALAERVADQLHLDGAQVERLRATGWWRRLTAVLQPRTETDASDPPDAPEPADPAATLAGAVDLIRHGLTVEPIRNSRLVRVHFDSISPAFSARAANAIAEGFIASAIERRFDASSYATRYLEEQLKLSKARLEESERALVAFALKENIVVTGESGQSLEGQNLGALNAALAAAQDQRILAQSAWNQVQGGGALPAGAIANSILNTLQQQRAQLQAQYQQQLQVFKPDYPSMLQLKSQMSELDRQIDAERAGIRASLKAEYDAAQARENMMIAQLDALRTRALDVDNRSIDYNILRREVDTNRQLYDGLLQRYKEIGVAGGIGSNNISIVDRAHVPTVRYRPNLVFNLGVGLLLGLLCGVAAATVAEFLDDTIKTPEDLEQHLHLAVLGIIPRLRRESVKSALADPRSAFSESYRSARTALQFSTENGAPKVLLVTSASVAEGKSTSALVLARNFAQLGKRVLLIEADMRNPSLHHLLGTRCEAGLSSLLAGTATLSQSVLRTDDERLKVILSGPLPPNPAELLSSNRLVSMLTIAAKTFDQVIIDGPPVLGIADAPILSHLVDGTLLVTRSGQTRVKAARTALKRLLAARTHVIGSLLTYYDAHVAGYEYEYAYSYGAAPRLSRE
ncbi:MAG: polysaccharide biosynthesis tyrosine autokinase [Dokdonella sp.]|nr:polysaccharide biosynthesis tyrosine autokinase [Dokdonella sp.]